jgi:hypothetical protein
MRTQNLETEWARLINLAANLAPLFEQADGTAPAAWEDMPARLVAASDAGDRRTLPLLGRLLELAEASSKPRSALLQALDLVRNGWSSLWQHFPPDALEGYCRKEAVPIWRCSSCTCHWAGPCPTRCYSCFSSAIYRFALERVVRPGFPEAGLLSRRRVLAAHPAAVPVTVWTNTGGLGEQARSAAEKPLFHVTRGRRPLGEDS